MDPLKLQAILSSGFPDATIVVAGEEGKFEVDISSAQFAGKNTIDRHRAVYSVVNSYIRNGTIHALTIRAKTPEELRNT